MSLHVTNRAEVVEVGSILLDAARELACMGLMAAVAPVFTLARWVDDLLFDGGESDADRDIRTGNVQAFTDLDEAVAWLKADE